MTTHPSHTRQPPGTGSDPPVVLISGGEGDLARVIRDEFVGEDHVVLSPSRAELDVSSEASVEAFFSREVTHLDVLINNAAITIDKPLARLTEDDWNAVIDTNLRGAFLCSRAASRIMVKRRRGHIINIGSFSALSGPAGQANYASAKAGLIALGQSLARELGSRNIRVNTVLPGFLETKMTSGLSEELRRKARSSHALGRFNTSGASARFLVALDAMEHVSGQVFQLDSRISHWT